MADHTDQADIAAACAEALASKKERLRGLRYGRIEIFVVDYRVQDFEVTERFRNNGRRAKAKPPASPFDDN